MTPLVLADAGPLYAGVDLDDAYHLQVLDDLRNMAAADVHVALTLPVAQEVHSLLLRRLGHWVADRWLQEALDRHDFLSVIDEDVFLATQLIARYTDQPLSLVDGILATLSHRLEMPVWSYDHHMDVLGVRRWFPEP